MAINFRTADMIQKNSSILVNVEEALADLIVVSYNVEDKRFQGVLLDMQKSNLPFGVYNLHPAFTNTKTSSENKDDTLHSVSQRFAYQNDSGTNEDSGKKYVPKAKPQQRQKMTVRLRPRKVLCSNCKGICNENNENVDVSKKRKLRAEDDTSDTRDAAEGDVEKKFLMQNTLIPKLSRLHPQEISNAMKGSPKGKGVKASDKTLINVKSEEDRVTQELTFVDVADKFKTLDKTDKDSYKDQGEGSFFSSAKTLKICFGEGEGTVVKIPAILSHNEDSGVSCDMSTKQGDKAVKKALRRAKRQEKRKNVTDIKILSPKHVGALSPRNTVSDNSPNFDVLQKKHKHKLKHKRKCKVPKMDGGNENTSKVEEPMNYFSDIKNCLSQKLSISLRRLSSNSYEKCDGEESGSDGWESDALPDFPTTCSKGVGNTPMQVSPGDVVWGKVVGFPWWPGRVMAVTTSHARVAWYASTTCSLMPSDRLCPFTENYKLRFNKKKRGPYKEAVDLATVEANNIESQLQDPLASPTHVSPQPINVFS